MLSIVQQLKFQANILAGMFLSLRVYNINWGVWKKNVRADNSESLQKMISLTDIKRGTFLTHTHTHTGLILKSSFSLFTVCFSIIQL